LAGDTLWVRANDGDVWGAWSQAFTVNPWVDSAPAVTVSNARAVHGESFAASSLFGVSDADGDAITKYAFWDIGTGGGHLSLNGVAQGTNQEIDVTAAQPDQQICLLGYRSRRRPFPGEWRGAGDEQRNRCSGIAAGAGHVSGRLTGRHALGAGQ
jgi:hypothetical protein